jgi:ABC-type multidrug transport system fused ATPase/permease subunit
MESSIFRFVLRHSRRETLAVCAVTLASFPFYYLSLEVPKNIVNLAILGKDMTFPVDHLTVNLYWVSFQIPVVLSQAAYLFVLCGLFLFFVVVNGGMKQYINTLKGRLGERLLRRMRYELISRIMRFPLPHFRKASAGELIPMITAEVEPLGGFMGDAIAQPLIQAGTLLTIVGFLFIQNPLVGIAAISLYPIQGYLIPKMQRRVNMLSKERVRAMRKVSERIGEGVAGIQEIHTHGTANYERADFAERLGRVYFIRFEIYLRKAAVKFWNNFLNQMVPLMFYSIGGYLVLHDQLTVGALTAAIGANKDMTAPWKELLDYYQQFQDSKIKYDQVTEQFRPENMLDEKLQSAPDGPIPSLNGPINAANLTLMEDTHGKVLDGLNFTIRPGEKVAVVGPTGGGKEALAMLLARLYLPSGGRLLLGGHDATDLREPVAGARIGYAGQGMHLISASVRDNLAYGLRQRPVRPKTRTEAEEQERRKWLRENARAGNSDLDIEAEWTDYQNAGAATPEEFQRRTHAVLAAVDLDDDVYQLGLRGTISPASHPAVAEAILQARKALRARISGPGADPALTGLVEPFDPARYNANATIAENLLFGTPVQPKFDIDQMAGNPHVLAVLDKVGLTEDLIKTGRKAAETMVELFKDLPPDHEFFAQFSFISSDDLPTFQSVLARVSRDGVAMSAEDRTLLLSLPFKLIEARHRLGLIDEKLKSRILEARVAFHEELPKVAPGAVAFFEPETYNAAATLQDNILFGKLAYGQAKAMQQVGRLIAEMIDELQLRPSVIEVGLDFQVGVAGARLAPPQRQKLGIARNLLKRPDIMVVNEATSILDGASQARIMDGILRECEGRTLVWVLHNAASGRRFDRVFVLADGRLVEDGSSDELAKPGTLFSELVAAE